MSVESELTRANELFIQLLSKRMSLVNLGYNGQQIDYILPCLLGLLQSEGQNYLNVRGMKPYLFLADSDKPDEFVIVNHLPGGQGFNLYAEVDKGIAGVEGAIRLALFNKHAKVDSVDYLIKELYSAETGRKLRRSNAWWDILWLLNLGPVTYEGGWNDERKLEFRVGVNKGRLAHLLSEFPLKETTWRRLNCLRDDQGEMVPFGQKIFSNEITLPVGSAFPEVNRNRVY